MSKRKSGRQITKDDNLDEGGKETEGGDWREKALASKEKLAQRKIISVRRKKRPAATDPGADAKGPTFDLGAGNTGDAAKSKHDVKDEKSSAPLFDFGLKTDDTDTSKSKAEEGDGTTGEGVASKPGKEEAKADDKGDEFNFVFGAGTSASEYSFTGGKEFQLDTSFKGDTSAPSFEFKPDANPSTLFKDSNKPIFKIDDKLSFGDFAKGDADGNSLEKDSENGASVWKSQSFTLSPTETTTSGAQFKEGKPADKGDSNDEVMFKRKSKVYELSGEGKDKTWKERGIGDLHVNAYTSNGKRNGRLILRNASTKRLVLNCPIHAQMEQQLHAEKFIRFLSVNITDDESDHDKIRAYLVKFKTKTEAQQALEHISRLIPPKE